MVVVPKEIGDSLLLHFGNLFRSTNPSIPFDLAGLIAPAIFEPDLAFLDSIPSRDESFGTLLSLGSNKSPRPDGLLVLFSKEYWSLIGGDCSSMVQDFFNGEGECWWRSITLF